MDRDVLATLLGKYIHERRTELGLTQLELADKMGFTAQYLGRIENGVVVPSKQVMKRFVDVLSLDPSKIRKIFQHSMKSYIDDLYGNLPDED